MTYAITNVFAARSGYIKLADLDANFAQILNAFPGLTGVGAVTVNYNPTSSSTGQALGVHINISSNSQPVPTASDFVGIFDRVTNDGLQTAHLWGMDILVQQAGAIGGNHQYRGIEVEMSGVTSGGALQTDPFSGTNLRYNGIEIVGVAGSDILTAAMMCWSNNTGTTGWWNTGIALSRVVNTGISFVKLSGDAADPFATTLLDVSTLTANPQTFVLGNNSADTHLVMSKVLLGIGVNPSVRLEVLGAAGNGVQAFAVHPDNTTSLTWAIQRAADGTGTVTMGTSTNHNLRVMTNNVERLNIDNAGVFDFLTPTNGAAGFGGTLGNAPVAGDPAYWLTVKIAGTTRRIPCW